MKDEKPQSQTAENPVVETTAIVEDLSLKHKAGDAANRWLARNRSLVLRQTPVWAQSLAVLMIGLGSIAVIGGVFFRIDEVVTAQGQLQSIGGTVQVKTPAGGQVSEVLFKDGDHVSKGQLLLRFDTRQALADKATYEKLIVLEEQQLAAQLKSLNSQKDTMNGRMKVLNQRLTTKKIVLSSMESLVKQGGFQRLQYLEQKDKVFELNQQMSEIDEQISRVNIQEQQTKLESTKSIDQMKSRLKQADLQLQYQNVSAPSSGIVFDPKAREEGVLSPGERILSIVPQQGLFAEVFVPNKDIGFIKIGQEAKVRVDAFPFSRYGDLPGKVKQIAADALPPDQTNSFYRFPVKIELKRSFLETEGISIPLKSGMAVSTNLKLRDKRVISLISDIFVDQTDSIRSIRQQ